MTPRETKEQEEVKRKRNRLQKKVVHLHYEK